MTVILSGAGERSRWRGAPAPGIRVRRPPTLEPPDEPGTPATGGELPLDWPPAAAAAQRRPVDPVAPPSSAVASAQRYVRTCIEVLNGFRPASHLRTLAGPVEFGAVVAQLGRRRNGCGHFAQPVGTHGRVANGRVAPTPARSSTASTPPNASRQPTGVTAHRGPFPSSGPSAPIGAARNAPTDA